MSENISTNQTVLDSSDTSADSTLSPSTVEPSSVQNFADFSIDSYADSLMEELFQDLEHSLDQGTKLPTEPVKPAAITSQATAIPGLSLSPTLVPYQQSASLESATPQQSANEGTLIPLVDEEDRVINPDEIHQEIKQKQRRWQFGQSLDRLLLIATCTSLIVAGAIWFILQTRGQQAQAPAPATPTAEQLQAQAQAQADANFLNYVQRSLEAIARRAGANRQGSPPSGTNLPTVSVPGNPSQPSSNPSVIERVYIPIYQQPPTSAPNPTTLPPGAAAPIPSLAPAPVAPPVAAAPTVTQPPNIASTGTHRLVGTFEWGDRSAALFEINGSTQRIYVGENIGSSGWTLVSVEGEEVIVRRNGEVRSIYMEQQF
jgi:hypothetical protein